MQHSQCNTSCICTGVEATSNVQKGLSCADMHKEQIPEPQILAGIPFSPLECPLSQCHMLVLGSFSIWSFREFEWQHQWQF